MKIYNQTNWDEEQQLLFIAEVPDSAPTHLTWDDLELYVRARYKEQVRITMEEFPKLDISVLVAKELYINWIPNNDPDSITEFIMSSDVFVSKSWDKDKQSEDQNDSTQIELQEILNPGIKAIIRILHDWEYF